jgi:hypothetical protein
MRLSERTDLSVLKLQTIHWMILLLDRIGEHDLQPRERPMIRESIPELVLSTCWSEICGDSDLALRYPHCAFRAARAGGKTRAF